jgi:hypothetical protein
LVIVYDVLSLLHKGLLALQDERLVVHNSLVGLDAVLPELLQDDLYKLKAIGWLVN